MVHPSCFDRWDLMVLKINGGSGFRNGDMHGKLKFLRLINIIGATCFNVEDQSVMNICDKYLFRSDN